MDRVRVSERAAQRVREAIPWVWRPDVRREPSAARPCAVVVEDPRGRALGSALWSPTSPVALRVYHLGGEAPFSSDLLRTRLTCALARRRSIYDENVDAYRIAHAEADDLPGLVIDRYDDVLVVQIGCAGIDAMKGEVVAALRDVLSPPILVTCSCSGRVSAEDFGGMLASAAANAGRRVQILERRRAGRDHPERVGLPETGYLKCWILRVLPWEAR